MLEARIAASGPVATAPRPPSPSNRLHVPSWSHPRTRVAAQGSGRGAIRARRGRHQRWEHHGGAAELPVQVRMK